MVGVGRDLCGSSSPTPLPKQGHLQQAAQDLVLVSPFSPFSSSPRKQGQKKSSGSFRKGQDSKDTTLRLLFLRWQCQLKQHCAVPTAA